MVNKVSKPTVGKKEEDYRQENFPDVNKIVERKLLCTSCNISVKPQLLKGNPKVHPFMDTLLCDKCFTFFGDGDFSTDEDGSDKYCRWCGQGGTLYLCSKCTAGFCKRCIKRNLPRAVWKEVEDDDWQCLCCNVAPLYELRAQAWAALEYVKANFKDKNDAASRKRKAKADSDSESESSKKMKKSDEANEEEDTPSTPRKSKSSRDKTSKKKTKGGESSEEEQEEKKLQDKLKNKQFRYARSKITNILVDIAKMMEVTKRKAEDFKKKKVSAQKINDLDSVLATVDNVKTMLLSMEELSSKLRDSITDFATKFEKSIKEENGVQEGKKEAEENGELDESEKKDEAIGSESEKKTDQKGSADVDMEEVPESKADGSSKKEGKPVVDEDSKPDDDEESKPDEDEDSKSDEKAKSKSDDDAALDDSSEPTKTSEDSKEKSNVADEGQEESN